MKDDTFIFTEIKIWKLAYYGQQKIRSLNKKMIYDELKFPWNKIILLLRGLSNFKSRKIFNTIIKNPTKFLNHFQIFATVFLKHANIYFINVKNDENISNSEFIEFMICKRYTLILSNWKYKILWRPIH